MSDVSPPAKPMGDDGDEDTILVLDDLGDRAEEPDQDPAWRLLIIDDDPLIHRSTVFALKNLEAFGRGFAFTHAYSAAEARSILERDRDFAVILLDVVMESAHAGLELVRDLRGAFGMVAPRIILRTGHPGYAPEMAVIQTYDIDDYRTKDEMTQVRLYTSVVSAVRSYRLIREMEKDRRSLRGIIDAAAGDDSRQPRGSLSDRLINFVSIASHEFRTGIANIQAAAEILERRWPGRGTVDGEFQKIHRAVERLHRLIENCVFEDRLNSAHATASPPTIDVEGMIREIVADIVPPIRQADIQITVACPAPLRISDPVLAAVAVSNLLDNAAKYAPNGTPIDIGARVDGRYLVVTVADRGPGVADDERSAIFDKFYRSPTVARLPGDGLGLHIVQQVADLHRGGVSVAPRDGDGGGAVFTLRLLALDP